MNLNILSRAFEYGNLGLLGIDRQGVAAFILAMEQPIAGICDFISERYQGVNITISLSPEDSSTYVTFSIRLLRDPQAPSRLLKSVVDELKRAERRSFVDNFCWASGLHCNDADMDPIYRPTGLSEED